METFLPGENLFISKNSCEFRRLWQNCRRQSNIRLAKTFRSKSEYEVDICRHLKLRQHHVTLQQWVMGRSAVSQTVPHMNALLVQVTLSFSNGRLQPLQVSRNVPIFLFFFFFFFINLFIDYFSLSVISPSVFSSLYFSFLFILADQFSPFSYKH